MYAAIEVHTEETIAAGEREILKYDSLLKVVFLNKLALLQEVH